MSDTEARRRDGLIAARNAMIVGASLLVTWSLALIVRLLLPRHLGPDLLGEYTFADALAMNGMTFLGLGIDSYIQKEIPKRQEHAGDFFLGVQTLRALASLIVLAIVAGIAWSGGHRGEVIWTTVFFGVAQLCMIAANTTATLLYAVRRVGRLSALNIGTKILWGSIVVVGLVLHAPLRVYALASVASEAVRLVALVVIARRAAGLELALHVGRTATALRKSFPFYVSSVAQVLYSRIDIAVMGLALPEREVGWYGAATNLSFIAMMVAPIMTWVLMPQLARAAAKSREELMIGLRSALEMTFIVAIGLATLIGSGADVIVHLALGSRFDQAIPAMRVLSPIFVVVYVAMLGATTLVLLHREWFVTVVTLVSFALNAGLNVALLGPSLRRFGDGGGGIGAAAISVAVEALVAGTFLYVIGRDAFDRRTLSTLAKCVLAAVVVLVVDHFGYGLGSWRIVATALTYFVVVVGTRALRLGELFALLRASLKERGG